ncbi:Ribosomal protein L32e [Methanococcus vannielii SB]|jgi:large subunit ribosomal protein L32e|uniref:Large ribosomal subunit protein eL32 n=2 Tax=Methanococcus vannielii TaxID=2187 RepID=RL32_METVS|nr:50S ribosomal protein L32e [Methanococcus vannielii]A6UQ61.1 RecName: Full=Large ribosomal subunit protein eL32; AltName: Full=50S ribosomal protein L32e [Methanococcus vannielii SB]P14549.1 RecName: Full=Large ribosomal subunit protein eL32; AltName: Full=50S ribosomal protein L32e; AltName: Full=ORF D [Methanococcus vannielii]ABR54633.1 Ribosomal protein L32e [Methanococcus vannielii SB]CAA34697.1 unnamed protein product [Methanococcus vannielii]
MSEFKRLMRLKLKMKQKRPEFKRQDSHRFQRIGTMWRRPTGHHSGQRIQVTYRLSPVKIGFRGPALVRGLHPSGLEDIIVNNVKQLAALNPKTQGARIASAVGTRKRIEIVKKANELGIRVFNVSKQKQGEFLSL